MTIKRLCDLLCLFNLTHACNGSLVPNVSGCNVALRQRGGSIGARDGGQVWEWRYRLEAKEVDSGSRITNCKPKYKRSLDSQLKNMIDKRCASKLIT